MFRLDTALSRCAPRARGAHVEAHRRKGFNLVEAAIVLGVIGLVIGGIWVAASAVIENQKRARMDSALLEIVEKTRSLYKDMPVSPGMVNINNALIAAGVIPEDLIINNLPITPYGSAQMNIFLGAAGGGRSFSIDFPVYSKAQCAYHLTKFRSRPVLEQMGLSPTASRGVSVNLLDPNLMAETGMFSAYSNNSLLCPNTRSMYLNGAIRISFVFEIR